MPVLKDKEIVGADPEFVARMPGNTFGVHSYVDPANRSLVDLFIAVAASSLPEHAKEIQIAIELKQFRILFLREDIPLEWLPEQLLKANLPVTKLLPKLLLYSDWSVPDRVIKAWADNSQQVLIADAFASKDSLVVRNCALEKLELSFTDTPVLRDIPIGERAKFEIDESGSFIHWEANDTDLDFDSLRYFVDPAWQKKCDADQVLTDQGFGYAVKGIRALNKLTQTDVETSTGISERQLRRYETEGIKPRVSSLEKLAQAHKMDLNTYLGKLATVVGGPTAIIIQCDSEKLQAEIEKWLRAKFSLLACEEGRARPIYRPRGSKEYDIWTYDRRPVADDSKEQLGLAVRVDLLEDFETFWSVCSEHKLHLDTAVGIDQWPSMGFVPATKDYVTKRLLHREAGS